MLPNHQALGLIKDNYLCDRNLRTLRKSFRNPKTPFIIQDIVEQAPSPAQYSRGRLFDTIFAEILTGYFCSLLTG